MAGEKNRFTLVLVPHSTGKVRSLRFSRIHVGAATTIAITALLVLWLFTTDYCHMLGLMPELHHLRQVVASQRSQIHALVQETNALEQEFRGLARLDREVRELLASIDLAPEGEQEALTARVASSRLTREAATTLVPDSPLGKDQGGGSLAVGHMALLHLERLREDVGLYESGLMECKHELAHLQEELSAYPSGWPVYGRITSGFGYRRSPFGWGTEFHGAIDIAAAYGTPIRATADGRVVVSEYRPGYGRTIIIDHGFGYNTVYCHHAENIVGPGTEVTRGQTIALLGNSGATTGPHLHYEIHYKGKRVNPRPFLQGP